VTAARILVAVVYSVPVVISSEDAVRYFMRTITWNGRAYRFEPMPAERGLESAQRVPGETREWAVSLQREFIGAMTCPAEVTTGEFEVRCERWLEELLSRRS
jgi:hypothetical protein